MDTERLTLRRLSPEDEAAFLTGLEDAELRRLYGFPAELPRETALRIFQQFAALPAAWGIVRREDGALTGFLLDVDLELPEADRRALPKAVGRWPSPPSGRTKGRGICGKLCAPS